ncbi:MAG: A24 family peptidase [Desulfobacterales bacterium]
MNVEMPIFLTIFLSSILIIAVTIDIRVRKIPNLLTFPAMLTALTFHSVTGGFKGFVFSLEGLALGMALFLIPYIMGGMGAGDAKLMGAIGAIVGPRGVFLACLFTCVAGGFYALIVFLLNRQYFKSFIQRSALTLKVFAFTRNFIPIPADESEKKPRLCYGVAIAAGTFSYLILEAYGYNPI